MRIGGARAMLQRSTVQGSVTFPAVAGLVGAFVESIAASLAALGRSVGALEREHLHALLSERMSLAPSPARVRIHYRASQQETAFDVDVLVSSLAEEYTSWSSARERPLFGVHPDARLLALLDELALGSGTPCLDIGAGTGRNSLPLAERGLRMDCVEMTESLAEELEAEAKRRDLSLSVLRGNIFDLALQPGHYALAIASEVTSHFGSDRALEEFFVKVSEALRPGGHLLVNVFVARAGWRPDSVSRAVACAAWSALFTRDVVERALRSACLEVISEAGVLEYERDHQPAEEWPPTRWFEHWASGRDVFAGELEESALELRWFVVRKTA